MAAIEPSPTPESATQTSVSVDTPTPTPVANLLLVYDDVAVNVINISDFTLSLVGVTFERLSAKGVITADFPASDWRNVEARALKPNNCLQVLVPVDKYTRPKACKDAKDKKSTNKENEHFWIETANSIKFRVVRDGEIIKPACMIEVGVCEIYLPQN